MIGGVEMVVDVQQGENVASMACGNGFSASMMLMMLGGGGKGRTVQLMVQSSPVVHFMSGEEDAAVWWRLDQQEGSGRGWALGDELE
jgi:hypothetical protein